MQRHGKSAVELQPRLSLQSYCTVVLYSQCVSHDSKHHVSTTDVTNEVPPWYPKFIDFYASKLISLVKQVQWLISDYISSRTSKRKRVIWTDVAQTSILWGRVFVHLLQGCSVPCRVINLVRHGFTNRPNLHSGVAKTLSFVMYCKLATKRFPLQIYVFALPLSLKQNIIESEGIRILSSSCPRRNACQQMFESHNDRVI